MKEEIDERKTLSELTLVDNFLFDQTMDQPEAHEAARQIILGQEQLKLMQSNQIYADVGRENHHKRRINFWGY